MYMVTKPKAFLQHVSESCAAENISKYHILDFGHQCNVHCSGEVYAPRSFQGWKS